MPAPENLATIELVDITWDDERARLLRSEMDRELTARYTDPAAPPEPDAMQERRTRALSVDAAQVVTTVVAIDADGEPLGHAALRRLGDDWEIKRVIVRSTARGRGIGRAIMEHLETRARAEGATRVILQTGTMQPESIAMYENRGYRRVPVYEPYLETMPGSLCYEKPLA